MFDELETEVTGDFGSLPSRYNRESRFYPGSFEQNYNRSYELAPEAPWAAIVLVHGLTDSPYSVRGVGEIFRDMGVHVVAPRMPGHGLAPSALIEITRLDWTAALRVAIRHARDVVGPDAPMFLGGYSNGGALVTKYTLDSLEDETLETPDQVYLFSPAIGITAFARLASWHTVLAAIPYFEKFRWESILPEFDPYKYNSFPKIAGHESWMLAREVHEQIQRQEAEGRLADMPPILCFQSLDRLLAQAGASYSLTMVTNLSDDSDEVAAWTRLPGGGETGRRDLGRRWPRGVFSMSHVAVPFPQDDPWYGAGTNGENTLGNIHAMGERRVLRIPMTFFNRLRHNPFFAYVRERIEDFAGPLRPAEASAD